MLGYRYFLGVMSLFFSFQGALLAIEHPYVEGEILVRYLSSMSGEERVSVMTGIGAVAKEKTFIVPNLELVELPAGKSVEEAIHEFQNTPGVLYASPNYILEAVAGMFPPRPKPKPVPKPSFSDPDFYKSYGISLIGAPKSWTSFTFGSRSVIVGVIDTGIDYTHEDLVHNIWKNPGEIPANGIDDDGNGYVDDIYGWNFAANNNNPYDDNRHGTHVAGTVGAIANNEVGTIGVSPQVSLMAVKFLDAEGRGTLSGALRAIQYAVDNGARVLNNSWGGGGYSQALLDTIRVVEQMGVLFVAAAGNWDVNNDIEPTYPASFNAANIIAVASTDRYDQKSSFSNYGKVSVDLGAPGSDVYSTLPANRYGDLSGTSMATPHVAGAAALIIAYKPALSLYQLKDLILTTVDPVDSLQNITVTGGRLNVYNALSTGLLSF